VAGQKPAPTRLAAGGLLIGVHRASHEDARSFRNSPGTSKMTQPRRSLLRYLTGLIVLTAYSLPVYSQEAPRNPLGELFRRIDREIRDVPAEEQPQPPKDDWLKPVRDKLSELVKDLDQRQQSRDQIDQRLPQRPEDHRRLRQAHSMIQQERWHEAVEILQYLLEQEVDSFATRASGEAVSIREIVEGVIGRLPDDGRRNYLNRYSPIAQSLLEEARREQDEGTLLEVSSRFFHTPAGREATSLLASLWEDQGELTSSARAWSRLAVTAEQAKERRQTARRGAVAWARTGQLDRARSLAKQSGLDEPAFLDELAAVRPIPSRSGELAGPSTSADPIEPVLIPHWSEPSAQRYSVQHQVQSLLRDLEDRQRAPIPSRQALAIQGKVAFRTLAGLQVRDLASGELLWEDRQANSPEQLLIPGRSEELGSEVVPYNGAMFEHHQLASLLFRDDVQGTLSTDGRHLFAIESANPLASFASPYSWRWRRQAQNFDDEQSEWSTNELVAYDLESGRVRWRVGGAPIEERFSRPLSGTYFFGPPTADGDDLFIVGEHAGEVSLFCLSARTGELNWSQLLAIPGRPIHEDAARRFWACPPVLEQGLVICPTTCGWLVALERRTRQLQWAYRFAPREEQRRRFRGGMAVQSLQELNRRWPATPPLVVGGRLLVTPPELPDEFNNKDPALVCLEIATGNELWKQDKKEGLYLAGVVGDRAIVVGKTAVTAHDITADGSIAWQVSLASAVRSGGGAEEAGLPSGQGVIAGGKLYLPLGHNRLVTIELTNGKVIDLSLLARNQSGARGSSDANEAAVALLGNLLVHRGCLISASPLGITVLPADDSGQELLAASRETGFPLQISRIELLMANGDYREADERLRELVDSSLFATLSATEARIVRENQWDCLVALIGSQLDDPETEDWLARLDQLEATPVQRLTQQRLRADRYRALGEWQEALERFLTLLEEGEPQMMIPEGQREVRLDGWIGSRLQRMIADLSSEEREQWAGRIQERFHQSETGSPERGRLARATAWHRLGAEFELELAREAWSRGRISEAVLRVQRVLDSDATDVIEEARASKWPPLPESAPLQAATPLELLEQSDVSTVGDSVREGGTLEWGKRWEVVRGGRGGFRDGVASVEPSGEPFDAFSRFRFLYENRSQRLQVQDAAEARMMWSLPLRSMRAMEHNPNVGIRWLGSTALVMHRGVVHALRIPEGEITWTFTPHVDGLGASRLAAPIRQTRQGMQSASAFGSSHRLSGQRSPTGYLLAANSHAVLLLVRDLVALDPITGEVLWRDGTISGQRQGRGNQQVIAHAYRDRFLVFPQSKGEPQFLRSLDGAAEEATASAEQERPSRIAKGFSDAVAIVEDDVISLTDQGGERLLRRRPPGEEEAVWEHSIDRNALLGMTDDRTLCWLSPEGTFSRVALDSGDLLELGTIPAELLSNRRQVSVLTDAERYYLVIDSGSTQISYVNLPSIRTGGAIVAFDRQGGLLWSRDIAPLSRQFDASDEEDEGDEDADERAKRTQRRWAFNLLVQEFEENPLMLLVGDRPDHRDGLYVRRLRMIGLHKETGETAVLWERPSDSGGFSYLHVDLPGRLIELRTHSQRLQVRPASDR
jgi:outer membrane protein assembly factor BamB